MIQHKTLAAVELDNAIANLKHAKQNLEEIGNSPIHIRVAIDEAIIKVLEIRNKLSRKTKSD